MSFTGVMFFQVDEFVKEEVEPALLCYAGKLGGKSELKV